MNKKYEMKINELQNQVYQLQKENKLLLEEIKKLREGREKFTSEELKRARREILIREARHKLFAYLGYNRFKPIDAEENQYALQRSIDEFGTSLLNLIDPDSDNYILDKLADEFQLKSEKAIEIWNDVIVEFKTKFRLKSVDRIA